MKKHVLIVIILLASLLMSSPADFGKWTRESTVSGSHLWKMSFAGDTAWILSRGGSFSSVYARCPGRVNFCEIAKVPGAYNALFFQNARVGFMTGDKGSITRTVDAGVTWTPQLSPVKNDLQDLVFVGKSGWAVGADNTILSTADNGKTWTEQRSGMEAKYLLNGVAFLNDKIGWVIGYRIRNSNNLAVILHTQDGGQTWKSQTEKIVGGRNFLPRDVTVNKAGWVYIVGDRGAYLMTTDEGEKWTRKDFPFGKDLDILAISFGSARVGCLVGTNAIIRMTNDAGFSWHHPVNNPVHGVVNEITDVHMLSPKLGYALVFGDFLKYTSD
jgi:photosystem II stability/assembly factor-like uncharacterized protein